VSLHDSCSNRQNEDVRSITWEQRGLRVGERGTAVSPTGVKNYLRRHRVICPDHFHTVKVSVVSPTVKKKE